MSEFIQEYDLMENIEGRTWTSELELGYIKERLHEPNHNLEKD